jgi:Spy/CpxP family protein refolding chaperone
VSEASTLSGCPTAALRARLSPSLTSLLARARELWQRAPEHPASSPDGVRDLLALQVGGVLEDLDASPLQREAIDGLLQRTSPQLYALIEQTREERDVLIHALFAGEVDYAELERTQSELSVLASRGSELYVETLLAVRRVLTPAQQKLLASRL